MIYSEFDLLLKTTFGDGFFYGAVPKGDGYDTGDYVVLSFIDDIPLVADDKIYKQSPRYQLSFYSDEMNKNIDSFFMENDLIYESKNQYYIEKDGGWQTVYKFYI